MLFLNIIIILTLIIMVLSKKKDIYNFALACSLLIFFYSIILIINLHPTIINMIENTVYTYNFFNLTLNYTQGLDGISLLFIILTTLLIVICVLSANTIKYRQRLFFILLFLTEIFLINVFAVTEIIYFYIFFEMVLIPMFLIIGIYGSRQEKISALIIFFYIL